MSYRKRKCFSGNNNPLPAIIWWNYYFYNVKINSRQQQLCTMCIYQTKIRWDFAALSVTTCSFSPTLHQAVTFSNFIALNYAILSATVAKASPLLPCNHAKQKWHADSYAGNNLQQLIATRQAASGSNAIFIICVSCTQ